MCRNAFYQQETWGPDGLSNSTSHDKDSQHFHYQIQDGCHLYNTLSRIAIEQLIEALSFFYS